MTKWSCETFVLLFVLRDDECHFTFLLFRPPGGNFHAERSSNGSCRTHRASTRRTLALFLSFFSSFVSPLLPLGLGFLLARGNVRRHSCCADYTVVKVTGLSSLNTTVIELDETARSISTSCRRSSMRKWRHCTFLLSVRCSPSLPGNLQITLLSRMKGLSAPLLICIVQSSVVAGSSILEESNLDKTEGRRPNDRSDGKGDDSDPGPATRRDSGLDCHTKAGYDCYNNATVELRPEAVGWAPLWAGPLTTSLRGLWVSGYPSSGNGGQNRRAATKKTTK